MVVMQSRPDWSTGQKGLLRAGKAGKELLRRVGRCMLGSAQCDERLPMDINAKKK